MIDPILDEREWLEAIWTGVGKEEDFEEGRTLRNTDSSGSASSGKRKGTNGSSDKETKIYR